MLESFATKRRNKAAAKKFLKKIQKHGLPKIVITDKLPSYRAAFHELGVADRQLCGGQSDNSCENSDLLLGNHNVQCHVLKQQKSCRNSLVISAKSISTSPTKGI